MNPTTLRETMYDFFPKDLVESEASRLGVRKRLRKLDIYALLVALVMTGGSDDSGRQSDVRTAYNKETGVPIVRGTFYSWFSRALEEMLKSLLDQAIKRVWKLPPLLTGELAKVGAKDWIVVDSETVTLSEELAGVFPATSTPAGLKVHKYYSLGRNNVVDFQITPANEHDAPLLRLDERWRGMVLVVDLGYASHELIRECSRLGIHLVIRLKRGWKPRMLRSVLEDGELHDIKGEPVMDEMLDLPLDVDENAPFDFDVVFGQGENGVPARLVGVAGASSWHWCITLLPRTVATPELICQVYRARWEIELDNKRDKGAARLDQIRAEKSESVLILVYASLLRTILANHLVYLDLRDRPPTRAPLHGFAVALALNTCSYSIVTALEEDDSTLWRRLELAIRGRGEDPNWRRRPSALDVLRGITAPPGRRRNERQSACPATSAPYRNTPSINNND